MRLVLTEIPQNKHTTITKEKARLVVIAIAIRTLAVYVRIVMEKATSRKEFLSENIIL